MFSIKIKKKSKNPNKKSNKKLVQKSLNEKAEEVQLILFESQARFTLGSRGRRNFVPSELVNRESLQSSVIAAGAPFSFRFFIEHFSGRRFGFFRIRITHFRSVSAA